ncbi:hypothetical protein [Psychrilyobacter atlanticus]|uniref:hypothetical protein n=1 Tax=Psychrilyobacter atlanticus TaxID=271091 RepID=UPI000403FECC|nr:hypothetical protein [Psychrilyobacter atlanticus]
MKRIIGVIILNLVFLTYSYAGFSVIKPSFGITLNRAKTQEQLIMNTGNKNLRVKIYAEKPANLKDEELYMGDWVKVYPRYVTIPANGRKRVRFIVKPPKDRHIADGEYRCVLYYEEIKQIGDEGFSLRVGTPIYGRTGNLIYAAEYEKLKVKKTQKGYKLNGVVKNTGNTSFALRAEIKFYDKKNKLLKKIDKKAASLFRGTTKNIGIELEEIKKTSKITVLFYEKNKKYKFEKIYKL